MPNTIHDRHFGFLLHDISRLLRKKFDQRASGLGLTRAQWRVLQRISRQEGINQSALAEVLEVENITLGRHIDRLEEAGWVERRRDPADRRAWLLFLKEKVDPMMQEMKVISEELLDDAFAGFSDADVSDLVEKLDRIKENLMSEGKTASVLPVKQAS